MKATIEHGVLVFQDCTPEEIARFQAESERLKGLAVKPVRTPPLKREPVAVKAVPVPQTGLPVQKRIVAADWGYQHGKDIQSAASRPYKDADWGYTGFETAHFDFDSQKDPRLLVKQFYGQIWNSLIPYKGAVKPTGLNKTEQEQAIRCWNAGVQRFCAAIGTETIEAMLTRGQAVSDHIMKAAKNLKLSVGLTSQVEAQEEVRTGQRVSPRVKITAVRTEGISTDQLQQMLRDMYPLKDCPQPPSNLSLLKKHMKVHKIDNKSAWMRLLVRTGVDWKSAALRLGMSHGLARDAVEAGLPRAKAA